MASSGVEGLLIETHNWGKSVAFWQALGFKLEFETDHHSGQLRHPDGGPYIFLAERPAGHELELQPVLTVRDAGRFDVPASGTVDQPFVAQHWGVVEMLLRDPDGRRLSVQAPLPEGVDAPPGHG
ncbi:MAG TPA: hypothetical protein VGQ20_09750 [Acidimicrobiales bacterium]|jgi:hypothetical protein|nr:hypothetical protein [Acidimicrobiales bacterium]